MHKRTLMGTAAIIMLLTSFAFIQAQEGRGNGRLAGTVVNEKGDAIEGAVITLKYVEFNHQLQTTSNKKGQWGFIGLGKGFAVVSAEKEGYLPRSVQLPEPLSGIRPNPDFQIVMNDLQSAGKMSGDDNRDLYLRANSLFDNHRYEEALALYREFAQKNPSLYKIGVNIGNCLVELREYDQALAEFRKVLDAVSREASDLKGNNTAAEAFTGIGDLYLRQEKFKEAEENFRKSIDILPGDPALPYNVAEIMFAQGKMDDAEKYFQLAIQIKTEWPKPYLKLAYVSLNRGDMARAVEYLKQFCALGKDDPKLPEAQALLDTLQKK